MARASQALIGPAVYNLESGRVRASFEAAAEIALRRRRFDPDQFDQLLRGVELIDISARGATIRHVLPVRPGDQLPLRFEYRGRMFDLECRILDSRFITLGHGPVYESRLRLTPDSPEQRASIDAVIEMLRRRHAGRVTGNMTAAPSTASPASAPEEPCTFCRYDGARWQIEKRGTGETPTEGFVVPSYTEHGEIRLLCAAYERLDEEGRQLLRRFAAAG